jgi:anti-sigma factor RsiW
MNCQTVRNLISAYIDCELAPEQKNALRHHLFECSECECEYHQLLSIKKCLEDSCQESFEFSSLSALYQRLEHERIALVPENIQLYWGSRILMMAACLFAFFFSTFMLFPPVNHNVTQLAQKQLLHSEESIDHNISIDQSVNVYQASLVLP